MNLRPEMPIRIMSTAVVLLFLSALGCTCPLEPKQEPAAMANSKDRPASSNPLAGTSWRLVSIQSMDDNIGTVRPKDPSLFTMQLNEDGTVNMRLDCNRASGTWKAEPSADSGNGSFMFGPLAATRALCPPPNLDERIAGQAAYVRGYMLNEGRLYLSLMADGGILEWEPIPE